MLLIGNLSTQIFSIIHKPTPHFFLSPHSRNRGSSCCPLCRQFWWFPTTFPSMSRLPRLPLAASYHGQPSKSLKTTAHPSNLSSKWGISQNPNLFYLEFYGCFVYELCLDNQIDSYCAIFIEFGDVWIYGYLMKSMISWFCICWIATVENSGNYGIVQKFWICLLYILYIIWIFWKNFMNFGDVISKLWNFEENCPALDTNYVIMY